MSAPTTITSASANGETYPGADDNASGTAALLAMPSLCKKAPWQHDVVFAAFDAEELGLQGARAFVASPPIPKERIALNVNMDMVSRSAAREIYIAGTGYRPAAAHRSSSRSPSAPR